MPERVNKWYCGSCCGWLVVVDIVNQKNLQLLNPVTRARMEFPPLSSFQRTYNFLGQLDCTSVDEFSYVLKVILSTVPDHRSPKDCTLMAIVGNNWTLSFCKLGDDKWINVNGSPYYVEDVVYHNGKFFVVTYLGVTLSCEEDGNNNFSIKIIAEPPIDVNERHFEVCRYLVMSRGVLLHIERIMKPRRKDRGAGYYFETIRFNVFELT